MIELLTSSNLWPAVFGIIGVLIGGIVAILKDLLIDKLAQRRLLRYATVRLVCTLDVFVQDCLRVVQDSGQYVQESHGQEELYPIEEFPETISFAGDIDWRSLPIDLVYRILTIPSEQEDAIKQIELTHYYDDPPDHEEYFSARKQQFSRLGLNARNLAGELRAKFSLPPPTFEYVDPLDIFHQVLRQKDAQHLSV